MSEQQAEAPLVSAKPLPLTQELASAVEAYTRRHRFENGAAAMRHLIGLGLAAGVGTAPAAAAEVAVVSSKALPLTQLLATGIEHYARQHGWESDSAAMAHLIGLGLAAGKLVPELSSGASWPFELLGVGYSLLGVAFIYYGHHRQRAVDTALQRGDWEPLDARVATALTAAGIVLGAATVAAVLFSGS